jgi:hypothetical protein
MIGRADARVRPAAGSLEGEEARPVARAVLPKPWEGETLYCSKTQDHGIDGALDHKLIEIAQARRSRTKSPCGFE